MLTKETIEKSLVLLEDVAAIPLDFLCQVCKYRDMCDEHVRCTDGVARYLYEHQE